VYEKGPINDGVSPALALKTYLKKEIEEALSYWLDLNPWVFEEFLTEK